MSKKHDPVEELKQEADEQETFDSTETADQGANENFLEGEEPSASDEGVPQNEFQDLQQQLSDVKDKYLRILAEFENYKKRSFREKLDWMKTAAQDTMSALLPVLDDFDRAKKFAAKNNETGWSEGVDLVYQKLYNTLKNKGLEPMQSNDEPFDPELHEAITEIPAPSDDMKGKVMDTVEKGYRLNDKIIRHAKVVVGK